MLLDSIACDNSWFPPSGTPKTSGCATGFLSSIELERRSFLSAFDSALVGSDEALSGMWFLHRVSQDALASDWHPCGGRIL